MADRPRSGLRFVEVFVLVLVVGFLLTLFAPAIRNGEPDPRARCMNRQAQIAKAFLNYESSHRHFPGYANRIGGDSGAEEVVTSWVVPLCPFLEREDLWHVWKQGDQIAVYLRVLNCPQDRPDTTASGPRLSYVVNCGRPGDRDTPADGVFHNHNVDGEPVHVSLDYIAQHDGNTNTLLVSENIQAGLWTDTDEANVGMVWRQSPGPSSHINQRKDAGDRPQDIRYARPSSNHPSGVIVSFCDGHVDFLNEDVDYRLYQHLMTPDSAEAGVPGKPNPDDF